MAWCCCGLSLKRGSQLAAVYSIVLSSLGIATFVIYQSKTMDVLHSFENQMSSIGMLANLQVPKSAVPNTDIQDPVAESQVLEGPEQQDGGPASLHSNALLASYAKTLKNGAINNQLQTKPEDQPFTFIFSKVEKIVKIIFEVGILVYACWMISALILLCGLGCEKPAYLLPWLFYTAFLTGAFIMEIIYFGLFLITKLVPVTSLAGVFLAGFTLIILNVFSCQRVWSCYINLRDGDKYYTKGRKLPMVELGEYTDEVPEEKK